MRRAGTFRSNSRLERHRARRPGRSRSERTRHRHNGRCSNRYPWRTLRYTHHRRIQDHRVPLAAQLREQQSAALWHGSPLRAQHGSWQRWTPLTPAKQSLVPISRSAPGQHSPKLGSQISPGGRQLSEARKRARRCRSRRSGPYNSRRPRSTARPPDYILRWTRRTKPRERARRRRSSSTGSVQCTLRRPADTGRAGRT